MKDIAWPSSPPPPCLSPAWCHLSSVSLKRGHDYNVSIWKGPRWDSEPDLWRSGGRRQGAGSGVHMLRWWVLQPWAFRWYAGPSCALPLTGPWPHASDRAAVHCPSSGITFRAAGGHLFTLPGLLSQAAIHGADKGGLSLPLGLQAPQMPYIPGAGRERRLLWFLIKPTI